MDREVFVGDKATITCKKKNKGGGQEQSHRRPGETGQSKDQTPMHSL